MNRRKNTEYVRARPFADWLTERFEYFSSRFPSETSEASARVCIEIGWGPTEAAARKLYRYRRCLYAGSEDRRKFERRTEWFRRAVVEDALHMAGVDFYGMYPEFAHETNIPLEPAVWCPHCRSEVTPILGECPWDGWRLYPALEAAA